MLETVLFLLVGIGIGIFAGLCPGMHVNTTIPLILVLSSSLRLNPYQTVVMIVSIGMTEMFIDQINSVFIGAPDADTAISVLPAHRLLFEGHGYEAVKLAVIGGIGALLFTLVLVSLTSRFFEILYQVTRPFIHFVIIGVVAFMILSEKKPKKILSAALIIGLSGLLGILALNSGLVAGEESLFPVLTGLFGLSGLIISYAETSAIPEQKEDSKINLSKKEIFKSIALASIAGTVVGFLPAVGISEAAVMTQYLGGNGDSRSFLVTASGTNVANDLFSLISLYLFGNPRSGSSVAVQQVLSELTFFDAMFLIGSTLFASGIAAMLTLYLGKRIPKLLVKLNYKKLTLAIIVFVIAMVFFLAGPYGLLIAFTSTSIGMLCVQLGIRRSHCMGVLLVSTILFFTGLNTLVISVLRI